MIRKCPVNWFLYEKHCDVCDQGFYKQSNQVYMSQPPKYQLICDNCEHTITSLKSYPYLDWVQDRDKDIEWVQDNPKPK